MVNYLPQVAELLRQQRLAEAKQLLDLMLVEQELPLSLRLEALAQQGELLLSGAQPLQAEKFFRQALEIAQTPELLNGLGLALLQQHCDPAAKTCFERTLSLDSDNLSALIGGPFVAAGLEWAFRVFGT